MTIGRPPNDWPTIVRHGRKRTNAKDRICAHPECTTLLSVYNSDKTCAIHPPIMLVRNRPAG